MRCFIGCFLAPHSAQLVAKLVAARGPQPGEGRPVALANLHLTLLFAGEVTPAQSARLKALVGTLGGESRTVLTSGLTGFPTPGRARVVVVTLEHDEALTRWHQSLHQQWQAAGTRHEFRPHITLARCRRPLAVGPSRALTGLALNLLPPRLYSSDTRPEGARYQPVA